LVTMIYIGLDDTDMPNTRGTGALARHVAAELDGCCAIRGVSRHQLLKDPAVPMTKNNSANVVHVAQTELSLEQLADRTERIMREEFIDGSDPGLCVVKKPTPNMQAFGNRAKQELVTDADAFAVADGSGAILRQLGGTGGGIIGAVAGTSLASTGEDGRFVRYGAIRDLSRTVMVAEVINAGVVEVRTLDGDTLSEGIIVNGDKIRPAIIANRPIVLVEPTDDGNWLHVRRD
jgi:tRNA(Ile2) C34 agmatinyltransferase TiaS